MWFNCSSFALIKNGKGEKELEAPSQHLLEIIEYAHFLSHIHKAYVQLYKHFLSTVSLVAVV